MGKSAPGYALRGFPHAILNRLLTLQRKNGGVHNPHCATLQTSRLHDERLKPLGKFQRASLGTFKRAPTDNVSSHKTAAVDTFLADHPNVSMHFTPTYSSWLNQVENWFGRIQRDVIARGIFTSTSDLHKKLMRYIRQYNKNAKPLKWKYADPSRHIRCNSSGSMD